MTIDEAQTMLNAKAKCIERICKGIYEDCNEQKCDNCDLCYAQGTNGEQIELMLQCANWLEELKVLKENSISKEAFEKMKSKAYQYGYRKGHGEAIDDVLKLQKYTIYDSSNEFMNIRIDAISIDDILKLKEKTNEQ